MQFSNMGYTIKNMQLPTHTDAEWRVNELLMCHKKLTMTPCIGQTTTRNTQNIYEMCFTKRQTDTTIGPDMPRCLEDGSAWEPKKGAASRDTASGRRKQP